MPGGAISKPSDQPIPVVRLAQVSANALAMLGLWPKPANTFSIITTCTAYTRLFQRVVLFEQKRKVRLFGSKGFALSTVEVRALLSD
jgi:hypothetical protein